MIHQSFSFIIVLVVALIPAALVRGCTNHHGDRGECLSPLECEVTGGIRIGTFERCISAGGRDRRRVCCKRLPCSGINTNDIEEFIMVSVRCSSCSSIFLEICLFVTVAPKYDFIFPLSSASAASPDTPRPSIGTRQL